MAMGWADVANAAVADQNPGGAGVSTAGRTVQAAVMADDPAVFQVGSDAAQDHPAAPAAAFIGIAVLIVALKFAAEESGDSGSFGNIKVGVWNIIVITLSAVLGLNFAHYLGARFNIPGVSDLLKAA